MVVDIELLLIAVVQGLALATLATKSEVVIGELDWLYWPYVIAGFLLVVNFWTLATIHSVSFIGWPFDVVHTILYLLVTFIEVAAFAQITHPDKWFVFNLAFFLASALLYAWDMKMIRERKAEYEMTPQGAALYAHMYAGQARDLFVLLPPAILLQVAIVAVLWLWPDVILGGNRHLYVVALQIIGGLVYLSITLRDFKERRQLIAACAEDR
jgi:hypothetical protein